MERESATCYAFAQRSVLYKLRPYDLTYINMDERSKKRVFV